MVYKYELSFAQLKSWGSGDAHMEPALKSWFVDTDWLNSRLGDPNLVVFDATWYLPGTRTDARQQYLEEHIPNSLFFDIDDISDLNSPLPHMLPNPIKFSSRMRRLGVGDGMTIVIYDHLDLFSAARAWWMFRIMGVTEVYVLDGGMRKWTDENRPVDEYPHRPRIERHFTARLNSDMLASLEDVLDAQTSGSAQIIDARPPGRFKGIDDEPRPGVRRGHIPNSINMPRTEFLHEDGSFKTNDEIKALFKEAGIDLEKPIITSCGSGITAAIPLLALAQIGHEDNKLYDGSWSEWGANSQLPIEVG